MKIAASAGGGGCLHILTWDRVHYFIKCVYEYKVVFIWGMFFSEDLSINHDLDRMIDKLR